MQTLAFRISIWFSLETQLYAFVEPILAILLRTGCGSPENGGLSALAHAQSASGNGGQHNLAKCFYHLPGG